MKAPSIFAAAFVAFILGYSAGHIVTRNNCNAYISNFKASHLVFP